MTLQSLTADDEPMRFFATLAEGGEAEVVLARAASGGALGWRLLGKAVRVRHPEWGSVFVLIGAAASAGGERAAQRTLRPDVLSRLSHELRGALFVIIGFAELLGRAGKGELAVDAPSLLDDIVASAQNALAVIVDLNALARPAEASSREVPSRESSSREASPRDASPHEAARG